MMRITNLVLPLILISVFSLPAKTMHREVTDTQLPHDAWTLIFNMLEARDLSHALSACRYLVAFAEKTWEIRAKCSVPGWYCKRKDNNTSWREFCKNHAELQCLPTTILKMAELSKKEVEDILFRFSDIEQKLITHLEIARVKIAEEKKITTPQQIFSFFLAIYLLDFGNTCHVVRESASEAAWHAGKVAGDSALETADNSALGKVWAHTNKFTDIWSTAKNTIAEETTLHTRKIVWNATKDAITAIIIKLELNDPIETGNKSVQLGTLYVLAYITQPDFYQHLNNAYKAGFTFSEKDSTLSLSLPESYGKLAQDILELPELANNPYRELLKNLVESIIINKSII